MMRRKLSCPAVKRTCMVLPGIVIAAFMLAMMIVNMEAAFARLRSEPVFSIYPQPQNGQGAIFFPHAIQGTSLVAEHVVAYNGPYVEDGSNDDVTGIAALTLCNRGTQPLARVRVELQQGIRCLIFQAETILPGDTVLILEANRQSFERNPYSNCSAQVFPDDCICVPSNVLWIAAPQRGCLLVRNQSDRVLKDIRIEYKHWSEEYDVFLGGITLSVCVGDIDPGQQKIIYPSQFFDSNHIVRITYQ